MIISKKHLTDQLKMDLAKPVFLLDMCRVCMMNTEYLKESVCYELTPNIVDMLSTFADIRVSVQSKNASMLCLMPYKNYLLFLIIIFR